MGRTADGSERDLVARIGAGDDGALAAVFDRHAPAVFGVAARMLGRDLAADVCQEVFLALWDHPERFDPARAPLGAFLVMIARRRCIDHLRRRGRRAVVEHAAAARRDRAPHPGVEDLALAGVAAARVHRALAGLPADQRRAIELAYFDGLTFREVAVATGVPEGTAKSRLRLALARLATALAEDESMEP